MADFPHTFNEGRVNRLLKEIKRSEPLQLKDVEYVNSSYLQ
jgi:hypothetical protein